MDYSQFVVAVENGDNSKINDLIPEIVEYLISYLKIRFNAPQQSAEDCTNIAIVSAIQKIKEGKINKPNAIIYYMLTSAKNEYFNTTTKKREKLSPLSVENHSTMRDPLHLILEEERLNILKKCIEKLSELNRLYIEYWFEHPRHHAQEVANHFKLTINNVWTKKHRILKSLKKCYSNYINQ